MTFIFDFDHDHGCAPMLLKDLLGGKGANLAEMTSVMKLPVPPGFTISTQACRVYSAQGWQRELDDEMRIARQRLEAAMGRVVGDPQNPLLISVRSGAGASMPGMLDTILNLGLNNDSVQGLAATTNDAVFAFDSYRRFIELFGRIVLGIDHALFDEHYALAQRHLGESTEVAAREEVLRHLVSRYHDVVQTETGAPFPHDPEEQLRRAVEAVFESWNGERAWAYRDREGIAHDLGTAVNVQAMVFGNRDNCSGTGVAFTRNPSTGENVPYGDFLVNAQGEDVVSGSVATQQLDSIKETFPHLFVEFQEILTRLEEHYGDMCDVEFTIEKDRLWILQTRVGKRTGHAALRIAVDLALSEESPVDRPAAVMRITADHLLQVLHPQFADGDHAVLVSGLGASPGAAVGRCYFSSAKAVEAASRGEPVILVRVETSPEDVRGMMASQGILTSRGGLVSHAAVVARGWGIPAIVGADTLSIGTDFFSVNGQTIREGEWISIDGERGVVVAGRVEIKSGQPPEEFHTILRWADDIRAHRVGVRANADNGPDARVARDFGAEGIGLCRTEHMFLEPERLALIRRVILATSPLDEEVGLQELRIAQREDFYKILVEMDGLPVTVRLLDPPLHEFLPPTHELAVKQVTHGLTPEEETLMSAAREWQEVNPMLGVRGVRLGILKPFLYQMQVRALVDAVAERVAAGGHPQVEVLIPLVISDEEFRLARQLVEEAIEQVATTSETARAIVDGSMISIGSMIETPRSALIADQLAASADFFSCGTNDLTQMTFGFSRDDVEGKLMAAYLRQGLLPNNPFQSLDPQGVGELLRLMVQKSRAVKPEMKIGICGEHGGDPQSISLLVDLGVDYVSCSPFRVPLARLSVAQSLLRRSMG